jgi:hypothetical protein
MNQLATLGLSANGDLHYFLQFLWGKYGKMIFATMGWGLVGSTFSSVVLCCEPGFCSKDVTNNHVKVGLGVPFW